MIYRNTVQARGPRGRRTCPLRNLGHMPEGKPNYIYIDQLSGHVAQSFFFPPHVDIFILPKNPFHKNVD